MRMFARPRDRMEHMPRRTSDARATRHDARESGCRGRRAVVRAACGDRTGNTVAHGFARVASAGDAPQRLQSTRAHRKRERRVFTSTRVRSQVCSGYPRGAHKKSGKKFQPRNHHLPAARRGCSLLLRPSFTSELPTCYATLSVWVPPSVLLFSLCACRRAALCTPRPFPRGAQHGRAHGAPPVHAHPSPALRPPRAPQRLTPRPRAP